MPEIGATLREARMRARIDITEVEQATKIRAKYLRALENEEWNLLPGSTFTKSFLREYADYLGIDSRTLVEEYKLRYERPTEHELAISPPLGRERRGGPAAGATAPRWLIAGVAIALVLVALGIVGSLGGDEEQPSGPSSPVGGATTAEPAAATPRRARRPAAAAPARVSLRLAPTGDVYVCLVDGAGRVRIPGTQFAAGQQVPVQRARVLRLTLGNNQVEMTVNGRPFAVPASAEAIAYEITPDGVRPLPLDQAPTCT